MKKNFKKKKCEENGKIDAQRRLYEFNFSI